MIKITVKRNGAQTKIDMAREFLAQSENFKFCHLSDVIATLRCYEREGNFEITDSELTLIHHC